MDWAYSNELGIDRISRLTSASSFEAVVEMMCSATICGYLMERANSTRLKGLRRASFLLDVVPDTYDVFFNSSVGYRAQYAMSADHGRRANRILIDRLTTSLIAHVLKAEPDTIPDVITSLAATDAKVWILESEVELQMGSIQPAIHYTQWEAASEDGAGLLAPLGSRLEVKGGWLDSDGQVQRDPCKARRSEEIHAVGYS